MPSKSTLERQRNGWSWNLPDKFDKIRAHVMEGKELDKHTQKFYERAQQTFQWLCEGKTEKQVVEEIRKAGWGTTTATARKLIRGTKRLYNTDPSEAFKQTERHILIEMAKETYQMAKSEGDRRTMVSAIKELRALLNLDEQEGGLVEMYATLQLPDIIYTTDPKALYEEPEEEGTFEDLTEATALPAPEGTGSPGQ